MKGKSFFRRHACNRCQLTVSILLYLMLCCAHGMAQVNSWTKTASGYWEEPYWSLGNLPASNCTVMLTNGGWKALAIGTNASQQFPDSLRIQNLTISAPPDSMNTLLLNFAGPRTPLDIADTFILGSNGCLQSQYSGLRAKTSYFGGLVIQTDYSEIKIENMYMGAGGNAAYTLSNGLLSTFYLDVGGGGVHWGKGGFTSTFTQEDGVNSGSSIVVYNDSVLTLKGGEITYKHMTVGQASTGTVHQVGGVVSLDILSVGAYKGAGFYLLSDGTLTASKIGIGRDVFIGFHEFGYGYFLQTGGSVVTGPLTLGNWEIDGHYTLSNGLLRTTGISFSGKRISYTQYGGTAIIDGELSMPGTEEIYWTPIYDTFSLSAGTLTCSSMVGQIVQITQSGGTNSISGTLKLAYSMEPGYYAFAGGLLCTSNTLLEGGYRRRQCFMQSGGKHCVSNLLEIGISGGYSAANYSLSSGELVVKDIRLWKGGALYVSQNGRLEHQGNLYLAGGYFGAGGGLLSLGQLVLETNSIIGLSTNPAVLTFRTSSEMPWHSMLSIQNWNGSTNGGGTHQIIFGTDSTGLKPEQVSRIYFENPVGFTNGLYQAKMLPSGEIVPGSMPLLESQTYSNWMTLRWVGFWTLQESTNVQGPYLDVTDPSNPYTNIFDQSRNKFFRLRD